MPPLARSPQHRPDERRARERERMELAVLAANVDSGGRDVGGEALVYDPPEKRLVQPGQVDARDHGPATIRDELVEQLRRRLAPDGFHVLEARGYDSLLVPGADVGQVDVAEHHPRESL